MAEFLSNHIGTIVVLIVLAVLITLAVRSVLKGKKSGGSCSCGGGCSGCPGGCHGTTCNGESLKRN